MKVRVKPFGSVEGKSYVEIELTSQAGTKIAFSDLGARINRWEVKGAGGQWEPIVLGHEWAAEVFESTYYYGATVGPVAGRIAGAAFELGGRHYQLSANDGPHHLHGGASRYDLQRFDYEVYELGDEVRVVFWLEDRNTEYPAGLLVQVIHTYNEAGEWWVDYRAETLGDTICNLTNHVYFNLNGDPNQPVDNHQLQVHASHYLPLSVDALPTGEVASVEGTALDLRQPRWLGDLWETSDPSLVQMGGLDHPFVLDSDTQVQARLSCPSRGRQIEVLTTAPVLVVYSHNQVVPPVDSVWVRPLQPHSGIALEAQLAPDAVHHPQLGCIDLPSGQVFHQRTGYRLTVTAGEGGERG